MKGLSLWQPHASLVGVGEKLIETRGRSTTYRGEIAIHATKLFPPAARELCRDPLFERVLLRHALWETNLPRGAIVAVATLINVVPATWLHAQRVVEDRGHTWRLTEQERAFGNYGPGRFAWLLADIRPLPRAVPCAGSQIVPWQVPGIAAADVRDQLVRCQPAR